MTLYPKQYAETQAADARVAIHTIGHYMSTHVAMNILVMLTGRVVAITPVSQSIKIDRIALASNFKARSDTFPAGTAPHALVHNTL